MAVNLGDKPLADFTDPIEMMKDCHRRIEHFLDVLRKVDGVNYQVSAPMRWTRSREGLERR